MTIFPADTQPTFTVGDTRPPLQGTLADAAGPFNGTGLAAEAHLRRPRGGAVITRAVSVAADGTYTMVWATGDLDTSGIWYVEIQVTLSDGGIETWPQVPFTVDDQIG